MRVPIRIAVLECDTPLDNTKAKYGGYAGVFKALLLASAKDLDQPDSVDPQSGLEISKWNVMEDRYPELDHIDAILITGSRYSSFEDVPWINKLVDFTAKVLAHDRVRVIGVCFGHQIIGRALGIKVGPNEAGWETSVSEVNLTEKGKELFECGVLRVHQMHRDIVYYQPPDTIPLGSSPRCEVQGMYAPRRFITVQGHPEFNEEIVTEVLELRHNNGTFSDEVYEEAMTRVGYEHDGLKVGKAFLKFLVEG